RLLPGVDVLRQPLPPFPPVSNDRPTRFRRPRPLAAADGPDEEASHDLCDLEDRGARAHRAGALDSATAFVPPVVSRCRRLLRGTTRTFCEALGDAALSRSARGRHAGVGL